MFTEQTHFHRPGCGSCCFPHNLWATSWGHKVLSTHCLSSQVRGTDPRGRCNCSVQVQGAAGDTMSPQPASVTAEPGAHGLLHTVLLLNGGLPFPHTALSLGLVTGNPRAAPVGRCLLPGILLTSKLENPIHPQGAKCSQLRRTVVQVEQEAAHVLVVHFPSSVRFILRNDLKGRHRRKLC